MNDLGDSSRRIRRILTVIVLLAVIVLIAWFATVRMERGATSSLDESDNEQGSVVAPSPAADPSPSTEEDDEIVEEYEDVPPGTSDEDFDETWLEEPPDMEMAPDPSISTEEDDETRQEGTGEDDDERE